MQTAEPHVFAIGDANGLALLDSVAFAQARVAIETILGEEARFDLRWVPRCVYTDRHLHSPDGPKKRPSLRGTTSKF
jgi:dihydrolipoamide dehydrogenase